MKHKRWSLKNSVWVILVNDLYVSLIGVSVSKNVYVQQYGFLPTYVNSFFFYNMVSYFSVVQ